jgi:gamma-glutamyltranspeptidase/glutathione hydrolase
MQEAVNAPRFHHQWLPDLITFEPNTLTQNFETLKSKGYIINEKKTLRNRKSRCHFGFTKQNLEGADFRGDDKSSWFLEFIRKIKK